MTTRGPVVLLVGHCGPDAWALRTAVTSAVGDADVRFVMDDAELEEAAKSADLLLVNRVLDGTFANGSGIDLIRRLHEGSDAPPMMLVSNFAEAQAEAEAAGARPGFGKSGLYDPATRDRLKEALDGVDA